MSRSTPPPVRSSTGSSAPPTGVVGFTAMADGTADDYALLDRYEQAHAAGLADRVLAALAALDDSLGGYRVTRLDHSLQAATRARRDGADVDWVVGTLLHDLGDDLAPFNHSAFAAAIIEPYVRAEVTWVVRHHGIFQLWYYAHHVGGDRDAREPYRDHPWAPLCERFCERWDQAAFDPDHPTDPLSAFEDDVRAVFARPPWDPDVVAPAPEVAS